MFKKLALSLLMFVFSTGFAFAQIDVNKADQAALDGIKGVGPKMSKTILDERKKAGDFKDWADFQSRVKGIGEKNSANLSKAGLTVNGRSKEGVSTTEVKVAKPVNVKPSQAAGSDSSEGSTQKKSSAKASAAAVSAPK